MNYHHSYENSADLQGRKNIYPPLADDGVRYEAARPRHRRGVLEVLTRAFVNEPSTAAQTIGRPGYDEWRHFTAFYLDECLTNGLSTVAIDKRDGKTVVGALITRDFLMPPDPRCIEFVEATPSFAPIVEVLDRIDAAWFEKHSDFSPGQPGRVADLWMGGVKLAHRNHGIASKLGRLSLDRLTDAGFEYAIAECTGAYSQHLVKSAGFDTVFELPYVDFLWKGEAVFQNVPAPHRHWGIYEKPLTRPADA